MQNSNLVTSVLCRAGFLSPYFIIDPQAQASDLEVPHILMFDKKISHIRDLLSVLEVLHSPGRVLTF